MSNLIRAAIRLVAGHGVLILQVILDIYLVCMIIRLLRNQNKANNRKKQVMREEKSRRLVSRISNPEYLKRERITAVRSYPYKVRDGGAPLSDDYGNRDLIVDVSVQTQMLTRDYLLPVGNGILIGRAPTNTICIDDPDLAEHQCRLFILNKRLCVESLSRQETVIQRGYDLFRIERSPVELITSDILRVGENRVIISY